MYPFRDINNHLGGDPRLTVQEFQVLLCRMGCGGRYWRELRDNLKDRKCHDVVLKNVWELFNE